MSKEKEVKPNKKETVVSTTPLKKVTLANAKDEVIIRFHLRRER